MLFMEKRFSFLKGHDVVTLLSIWSQREMLPPAHTSPRSVPGDDVTADSGEEKGRDRTSGQSHTHSLKRNGTVHHLRPTNTDLSCLLTQPNTPLYPEGGGGSALTQTNGCTGRTVTDCKKTNGFLANGLEGK